MTREKAIAYGKDYYRDLITACCEIDEKHKEFVRMAISALEQEPCDDAVSRKAVLKKIDYEVEHYCKYLERVDDKRNAQTHVALVSDNIREEVEQLPPVTQKSWKWIITSMSNIAYCSVCDYIFKDISADIVKQFRFCPNCGARMVEPQESEE